MAPTQTMRLPLIPIRDVVVFPNTMFPFIIGRDSSVQALDHALKHDRHLFLSTQKDPAIDDPDRGDIFDVGTMAVIIQNLKLPDGNIKVLVEGVRRGRIRTFQREQGFFMVEVQVQDEPAISPERAETLKKELIEVFEELPAAVINERLALLVHDGAGLAGSTVHRNDTQDLVPALIVGESEACGVR